MTYRRWQKGEETDEAGPLELATRAELEELGWTPLTPPGPFRTASEAACLLAETVDHSQNAAALPGLSRAHAERMDEARKAATGGRLTAEDQKVAVAEVSDFEARRKRREQGGKA